VLPIGGLKEKLLAAHRGGIRTVLIPEENRRDLADIPKNIKQHLDIQPVKWVDQVLQMSLQNMPPPRIEKEPEVGLEPRKKPSRSKKGGHIRPH
jgi:ATP-dependent Lon protease